MKSRVNFIVDAFPLSSMTQAGDAIELHTKQDIVLQGSESINGLKRELTRI